MIDPEVDGLPEAHVSLEVRTTLTSSPLSGVRLNVGLSVPAFTPFTLH